MALIDILHTSRVPEPVYGDVRDLPVDQQFYAWRTLCNDWHAEYALSPAKALEELGLAGEDAVRFERLRGRIAGLEYNIQAGGWVVRDQPEWQRRVR